MNLIEAGELMEKGKKVRRKGWIENVYMYVSKGEFQACEIVNGQKIRKSVNIKDLKSVLADDWEIYKDEKEMLIKKGKLYDIARYCENNSCVGCILREKDECDGESVITGEYQRLETMLLDNNFLLDDWSDEHTDMLYKLIKED